MAYKHGVYNTEQATSLTVPIQGGAGLQVIFGTAPIHLAKDPAAAVNTPKLVYSYKEAVEAVAIRTISRTSPFARVLAPVSRFSTLRPLSW